MNIKQNIPLSKFTSFGVGGPAENFALVTDSNELEEALRCTLPETQLWMIGYGSNCLVSDYGLPGMVICTRGGTIKIEDDLIIADAGAWWDDVVKLAISNNLWGIEFLSEVPGSVGASTFINITAYGQSLSDVIEWIDVWDRTDSNVKRLVARDLNWDYKSSVFQSERGSNLIILKVGLKLSRTKKTELKYQRALDVASELDLDLNILENRRTVIVEARNRAGSLWHPNSNEAKTVGSFFRNPIVSDDQIEKIIQFDESGKTTEEIRKMNQTHGGSEMRVSAAHVMLAAGFKRGQQWNNVKLNDKNLLKIEALDGATATEIYAVMKNIQSTCLDKLGIKLEPEARILGRFD